MLSFNVPESYLNLNSNISKNSLRFEINGTVHGVQVFSEGIYYIFKGGKMLNCSL